jgi:type I restriction enzyme S subunit
MKRYKSYKPSGLKWIGEIPKHWIKTKFKYETTKSVQYGLNTNSEKYVDDGVRFLRTTDIDDYGNLCDEGVSLCPDEIPNDYLLEKFDFLISRSGTLGRTYLHLSNERYSYGGYLVRFNFGDLIKSKFVFYYSKSNCFRDWIVLNTIQSTIGNVNGEKYSNLEFVSPPLSEKLQIVQFLDGKNVLVDKLIKCLEQKIELLKEKRLSLIQNIILDSKIERIRLKYVVDLINRPIVEFENTYYTKIGMYNWGRGIFKYEEELGSELGDSEFSYIKEGDLILSGQFSWEGSVSIVESEFDDCICSHRFHILKGKNNILLNEYLWGYFTSQEGHHILDNNSNGFAGRNRPLNIGKLLKEKIPVPNLEIQHEIKNIVEIERKNNEYSQKMKSLLNEYRKSLITEVVTGKIKVTTDE